MFFILGCRTDVHNKKTVNVSSPVKKAYQNRYLDSTIYFNNKKIKIKNLLIENYQTDFSEGINYYFISKENDTIFYKKELLRIR
jgi:hypothetical protein